MYSYYPQFIRTIREYHELKSAEEARMVQRFSEIIPQIIQSRDGSNIPSYAFIAGKIAQEFDQQAADFYFAQVSTPEKYAKCEMIWNKILRNMTSEHGAS